MTDPRSPISDASIERALAYRAPRGADDRLLVAIMDAAVRTPQQRKWRWGFGALGFGSRRTLIWVAFALTSAMTVGALVVGGGAPRPTPSVAPDPLSIENGPITLSGYLPADGSSTRSVVGMPRCATCPAGTQPAWSRDGTSLAFIARDGELWTWHEGYASARQLVACPDSNCPAATPSWSPDGGSILFVANGRLCVIDTTTLEVRQLPLPTAAAGVSEASWSATDRIGFMTSDLTTGRWTIWASASDGSNPIRVADSTLDSAPMADIAIAPAGDRFVLVEDTFTSGSVDGFTIRIWLYPVDGAPRRVLYERPGCCLSLPGWSAAGWSPDGTKIAVVALATLEGPPTSEDIALLSIDAATGDRTVLAPVPSRMGLLYATGHSQLSAPAWRPVPASP